MCLNIQWRMKVNTLLKISSIIIGMKRRIDSIVDSISDKIILAMILAFFLLEAVALGVFLYELFIIATVLL